MARVVQRRGGPPYLLILFVFLFLVSTSLAVLFHIRNEEKVESLAELRQKCRDLGKKKKAGDEIIGSLVFKMTGQALDHKAAISQAEESLKDQYAKDYANLGLSSAIKSLSTKVAKSLAEIKTLKSTNSGLRSTIDEKDSATKRLEQELIAKVKKAENDLAAAEGEFQRTMAAKDTQRTQAVQEKDAIISKKDSRINALDAELEGKAMLVQQRDARIAQLVDEIRKFKGKIGKIGELRKPSGKIAKLFLDQKICYIDLGERDRVTPGLPFSVYSSQTGIPEDGKGKAKIIVTNVGPTTSECRIVESSRDDPIIEGDLIYNVVFSPTRTYKFVVEGEFDLYGTGRPDPLANRRVRALIEGFGGKVSDTVAVSTDFVVMGAEPPRPPKPKDAPPAVWRVYNEKMKTYDHYKQVKAMAISLQIPVLNTTRFLAFSGYVPKRRLTE